MSSWRIRSATLEMLPDMQLGLLRWGEGCDSAGNWAQIFFKGVAGSAQRDGFMLSGSGALRSMMIYEQELQEERQSLWLRLNESIKKFKDHDKIN